MAKPSLRQQVEDLSRQVEELMRENERLRQTLAVYSEMPPPGRPKGEASVRAETILELIKDLNAQLPSNERWVITSYLLVQQLGLKPEVAKQLLEERQHEIEAINQGIASKLQQNRGQDYTALRQELERRLEEKRVKQRQSPLAPVLKEQFLALLDRSKTESRIRDPLAVALLRQIREAKGLSQRELGEHIGQPQSVVAALEKGSRTLTQQMLSRYAGWLNLKDG